jgi:hypothetical protein
MVSRGGQRLTTAQVLDDLMATSSSEDFDGPDHVLIQVVSSIFTQNKKNRKSHFFTKKRHFLPQSKGFLTPK